MRITALIFDYVCAVCWSPLVEDIDHTTAVCARYGIDHAGYHRLSGVNWQRAHSEFDRLEVTRLYIESPFAIDLGLIRPPREMTSERFAANRRALGRDDTGF